MLHFRVDKALPTGLCSADKSLPSPEDPTRMHQIDTSGFPIGRALRLERVAAGVSVTAIADAVGVSIGHLSRIEKGERQASEELVARIRVAIRASAKAIA